jgi:CheY-like chemotaxis protein
MLALRSVGTERLAGQSGANSCDEREEDLGGIILRLFAGGAAVTEVTDWRAAVAQIAAGERFDAIVCDVPNGEALYNDVSGVDMEQARRMIFLAEVHPNAIVDGRDWYLAKPFRLGQLHDAIAATLALAPPGEA